MDKIMLVSWDGTLSDFLNMCNGVRQGDILSPFLSGIYSDDLCVCLQPMNIGCRLKRDYEPYFIRWWCNLCSFCQRSSTTVERLFHFAELHNVRLNVIEFQCLIVNSKHEVVNRPLIRLCSGTLPYTDNYKYLGGIINYWTRWLYCVECPQYSTRLDGIGYLRDCLSGRVQR